MPTKLCGTLGQAAFATAKTRADRGLIPQAILALSRQEVDPDGLEAPVEWRSLAQAVIHLVVDTGLGCPAIGSEVRFELKYSALLRAMTSPFVERTIFRGDV